MEMMVRESVILIKFLGFGKHLLPRFSFFSQSLLVVVFETELFDGGDDIAIV